MRWDFITSSSKYPSPDFPNFIFTSWTTPFIEIVTTFSFGRRTRSLPKRTWKDEDLIVPSSCNTQTMSLEPLKVAFRRNIFLNFWKKKLGWSRGLHRKNFWILSVLWSFFGKFANFILLWGIQFDVIWGVKIKIFLMKKKNIDANFTLKKIENC